MTVTLIEVTEDVVKKFKVGVKPFDLGVRFEWE